MLAIAAAIALGITPTGADAQETSTCKEGEVAIASLGYSRLECNCTIGHIEGEPSTTVYEFRAEPRIWGIEKGGPADGKLTEGDFVTAIDGYLITTAEGGKRFGALSAGQPVALTVRRDGRETEVTVTPVAECKAERGIVGRPVVPVPPTVKPAPRVVYVRPEIITVPREAVTVEVKTRPAPAPHYSILPPGWLGFSFSCSHCEVGKTEAGQVWWAFSDYPEITRVETGSPAHQAGLRTGDVLTHIDDHDLTDEKGGQLFGAVQPGDTVTLRYARQGEERVVTIVAGEREIKLAEPILPPPPKQSPQPDVQRFSGVFGDAFVEVTGGPIVVNRTGDELVISSKDITVRIRKAGEEGAP
jgi:hypothetical protein